jgi:hypothetical protein
MSKAVKRMAVPLTVALMCAVTAWQVPAGAKTMTNYLHVRPNQGPPGTQVSLEGQIMVLGCVAIWFVDSAGTGWFWGVVPQSIYLTRHVPIGAALGSGEVLARFGEPDPIWHTCRHFYGGLDAPFTVANGPGIFDFTPHRGPVGTLVTIDGVGFSTATAVLFHGVKSAFRIVADSEIRARVPSGARTGQIRIVTPIVVAGSGPSFTVT